MEEFLGWYLEFNLYQHYKPFEQPETAFRYRPAFNQLPKQIA